MNVLSIPDIVGTGGVASVVGFGLGGTVTPTPSIRRQIQ